MSKWLIVRWAVPVLLLATLVPSAQDRDRDGAWTRGALPHDCDDGDPTIHPWAREVSLDGVDQDCDGLDSAAGSNVVLLTIDTLRARNLGAYGYDRPTSPRIDRMAREGVLFRHAYAASSWTIPSLGSLFTARHPAQHGAVSGRVGLGEKFHTVTEVFKDRGYATGAFVHSAFPLLTMGFAQGFDHMQKGAGRRIREIERWIADHRDAPFFLWVHLAEPHTPYAPGRHVEKIFSGVDFRTNRDYVRHWNRKECVSRYPGDPRQNFLRMAFYDETIRESDDYVGRILDALRIARIDEKTLVVLTSDHGEEFFEHGGCDHGQTLYDEVLHIPLIVRHPTVVPAGVVVEEQVRLVDVRPTITDLLGLPSERDAPGRSLVPHVLGRGRDRPVISGFLSVPDQAVGIRHGGMKYVYSLRRKALRVGGGRDTEEFYDLEADPEEKHNLIGTDHPRLERFRRKAKRWLQTRRPRQAHAKEFDAETERRLKALGYLSEDEPRRRSRRPPAERVVPSTAH